MKKLSYHYPILFVFVYLLFIYLFIGIALEHLALMGFVLLCYYLHPKSKLWLQDFSPFLFFGILYDFLRIYPKSWAGNIHVQGPYQLEKWLFGFHYLNEVVTPNEFFRSHTYLILDIITGFSYSLHIFVPIGFSLFIWVKQPDLSRAFNKTFFLINLFAFATYILFPAAPPWYIEKYGFMPPDWSLPGYGAGLLAFDRAIGIGYFESVYSKNAWVFGAIPSMHGAYPFLTILYARHFLKKGMIPFYVYMALIWFSAVYLRHHYLIDLIVGFIYVLVGYWLVEKRFRKDPLVPK